MAEIHLTQAEADLLFAMEKHCLSDQPWDFPQAGEVLSIPLVSADRRENFSLDIHRGRIDLAKGTYQNRARTVVILARLDFGGRPHRNPDGTEIASPHLHLFREGYGDKWAFEVPRDRFPNLPDRWLTLQDFMLYCNIVKPPLIQRGLFS
jgi:hypothetical protein